MRISDEFLLGIFVFAFGLRHCSIMHLYIGNFHQIQFHFPNLATSHKTFSSTTKVCLISQYCTIEFDSNSQYSGTIKNYLETGQDFSVIIWQLDAPVHSSVIFLSISHSFSSVFHTRGEWGYMTKLRMIEWIFLHSVVWIFSYPNLDQLLFLQLQHPAEARTCVKTLPNSISLKERSYHRGKI